MNNYYKQYLLLMKKHRGGADFTHFASIPFIKDSQRQDLSKLQNSIAEGLSKLDIQKQLKPNNPNLFHLTLSMLSIPHQKQKELLCEVMQSKKQIYKEYMKKTILTAQKITYFTRKQYQSNGDPFVNVIYLKLKEDQQMQKIRKITDLLIRTLLEAQLITNQQLRPMKIQYSHQKNMFLSNDPHITLFRCEGLRESQQLKDLLNMMNENIEGMKWECQLFDISTRFEYDKTQFYRPLWRV